MSLSESSFTSGSDFKTSVVETAAVLVSAGETFCLSFFNRLLLDLAERSVSKDAGATRLRDDDEICVDANLFLSLLSSERLKLFRAATAGGFLAATTDGLAISCEPCLGDLRGVILTVSFV